MNIKRVDIACFMGGTFVQPFCTMMDAVAYNNLSNFLVIQRWDKTPTDAPIGMQTSDCEKKVPGGGVGRGIAGVTYFRRQMPVKSCLPSAVVWGRNELCPTSVKSEQGPPT